MKTGERGDSSGDKVDNGETLTRADADTKQLSEDVFPRSKATRFKILGYRIMGFVPLLILVFMDVYGNMWPFDESRIPTVLPPTFIVGKLKFIPAMGRGHSKKISVITKEGKVISMGFPNLKKDGITYDTNTQLALLLSEHNGKAWYFIHNRLSGKMMVQLELYDTNGSYVFDFNGLIAELQKAHKNRMLLRSVIFFSAHIIALLFCAFLFKFNEKGEVKWGQYQQRTH